LDTQEPFIKFAQVCKRLSNIKSIKKKVDILSEYLEGLSEISLPIAVTFLSGRIFEPESRLLLHVAHNTIMNVLSTITDLEMKEVHKIYLQYGDLGYLVEHVLSHKFTRALVDFPSLSMSDVYEILTRLAGIGGKSAQSTKKKILLGLFMRCEPLEGKYLGKILTNELRIGVSRGLLLTALAKSFGADPDVIQNALLLNGNIAKISILAKKKLLKSVKLQPLTAVSYMLADVMLDPKEISDYFGRDLIVEYKYDGIRAQVHKDCNKIKIFSRSLNDITAFFPDLAKAMISIIGRYRIILDGEILAYKNDKPLPFHYLQRRLNTKNVTYTDTDLVPVVYIVFDILYLDEELTHLSLNKRKSILDNLKFSLPLLHADWKFAGSESSIDLLFKQSKVLGYEGLVLKDPDSEYQLGKRGKKWIKLKKELDTLDVVVTMAEYGHGKKAGTLSDYTFAVREQDGDSKLLTIGKAYSGLSEDEINELTQNIKSIAIRSDGYRIWTEPRIVLEVSFDGIQKSERHQSGYALRFPRIKRIRWDKDVNGIDSLGKVIEIYSRQDHFIS
jgi:DNA ligase-1